MRFMLLAGASIGALLLPAAAHAEEATDDQVIVVTAERLQSAEREAQRRPGGTDVVAAADYENSLAVSLRDALAFSPGVYAQPRFGQEVRVSIRGSGLSRGFHMRGLTLLQDGVPINLADDNGDFQEFDPLVYEQIQVFRGANALQLGSATLGGAINGVTPTGRSAPGATFRLDGGMFDTIRGMASYGYADERGDAWVAVTGDSSGGDRNHADRQSLRAHLNVGVRLSDVVETRLYATATTLEQRLPGSLNLAQALTTPELSLPANINGDQARDIDSIRVQNRTTFDWGDARLAVGVFANLKELYHPIFQVIDQQSTDVGAYARFDYESGPLAITVGGDFRRGSTRARQYVNVAGNRGALVFNADQDARTASLYGEVRLRPVERLTLIAGAVYADGLRNRNVRFSASPTQNGRIALDEFSPKFGILYEPVSGVQLYANYSRSAELPGFGEVFQTVSGVSTFIGAIRAQRAWTAEVGARGRIGIVSFDVSLYRADLDGEMLQYAVDPNFPAATFNAGDTVHQGIEAGLDIDIAPWARLRQVYQNSDFRFDGDAQFGDNRLPVIPRHVYRAELRLGSERLNVAPRVEWVPEGAFADYRNTLQVDGYVTIGLTAEAQVRSGLSLFLDARNLADENAVGDISAVSAATPASVAFYPIERRAVYGGVRAHF